MSNTPLKPEQEHVGSIWKHPYMIYVLLTLVLFLGLVLIAYFALRNDLIPQR